MVDKIINIWEYNRILLGIRQSFDVTFTDSPAGNIKSMGYIWEYAITKILGWTPKEALTYLTLDIVKAIKLDKTFMGDPEHREEAVRTNFRIYLHYAFPEEIPYSLRHQTISDYERVYKLNGWRNDKSEFRLPKSWFSDISGMERSYILLNYLVENNLSHMNTIELYRFFNRDEGLSWLKTKGLKEVLSVIYQDSLEYLHEALPDNRSSDLYYNGMLMTNELKIDLT